MLGFFYAQKQVLAMQDRITVFSIYIIEKKIHTYAKAIRMSNLAISKNFSSLTADGNTINTVFVRKKAIRIRKFITKTELSSYCDSSVCLLLNVFRCL